MTPAEFIRRRQPDWQALETLLFTASSLKRRPLGSAEEVSRFAALYRSLCADLAHARAAGYPDNLVDYLNSLAARGHNRFYVSPPTSLKRAGVFFTTTFPATVRANVAYVAAGLLLFFGPLLGMVGLAVTDLEAIYPVVPRAVLEQAEQMHSAGHEKGRDEGMDMAMTGFYVKNNVGIAFQCFASGVFFGLGSILLLLFNGVMIGATLGFVAQTPSGMNILSFIVGHGPWELTAIALAGAAGLRLGFGPIITGGRARSTSFRRAGRDAVRLVLGAAAMLLVAALIEGFFSPSSLPTAVKLAVGGLGTLFLFWYFVLYRRRALCAEETP